MFNVTDALTARGHEVIPFSVNYTRNRFTPYARHFVEPLGGPDEVLFREQRRTPQALLRSMKRLFYAPDVEHAISQLVTDTKPQIAYVLHYLRKLSPSLLVGLKRANLPIVVRLSDYAMLCPQSHCLRSEAPCTLCIHGDLWPSVRYRCVQHSAAASLLNALATWFHRSRRYFDLIDIFLTTNQFMFDMMIAAGISKQRLRYVPTFVNGEHFRPAPDDSKDGYIVYSGRLEAIKGVHVLVDALGQLSRRRPDLRPQVKIIGSGGAEYIAMIKERIKYLELEGSITLIGAIDARELAGLLSRALFSIVPSIWYENLPNTVLESYACGTPVIASDIGSLTECVRDGDTGYLFSVGDHAGLAERIEYSLDHPQLLTQMSRRARLAAETIYSPQRHLDTLEGVFDELLGRSA